jgi:DNA-binding CsgD family transcriptional regulator
MGFISSKYDVIVRPGTGISNFITRMDCMVDVALEKKEITESIMGAYSAESTSRAYSSSGHTKPVLKENRTDVDTQGVRIWVEGVVKNLLPHAAMICIHSIEHSFGYEVVQVVSNGVPQAYLDSITTPRNNIRSKIFSRLMASERAVYLEANLLSNAEDCLSEFHLAGYTNLIGYSYRTNGEFGRVTNVAFFKVDREDARNYDELRQTLIPSLHAILASANNISNGEEKPLKEGQKQELLIAKERKVAELVVQGKSNKEIARSLSMNERTVKQYICNLTLKLNVMNRTALAVVLYKILH